MNNYILSYPRSGNTWTRFIVEVISQRPTLGCKGAGNGKDKDIPICENTYAERENPIYISNPEPIAQKSHEPSETKDAKKIIFLLRDWKECIGRNCNKTIPEEELSKYCEMLRYYHRFEGKKILIEYEDLLFKTKLVATDLYDFLQIGNRAGLNDFLRNVEFYREFCKVDPTNRKWSGSCSGNDTQFHSKRMSHVNFDRCKMIIHERYKDVEHYLRNY